LGLIEQIHQAADQSNYQNCHLSTSHKTINPEEDSLEAEDSPEVEDSPEAEDSPEEEDTQMEGEYHLEDCQEEAGGCHHYPCCKFIKESW